MPIFGGKEEVDKNYSQNKNMEKCGHNKIEFWKTSNGVFLTKEGFFLSNFFIICSSLW